MSKINFPDPLIKITSEDVYYPSDDSYLIIDFFKTSITIDNFDGVPIDEINNILDLGTGSEILRYIFH